MYIGSTGRKGLHHLLYEVLDNSIDEVQAGNASVITVELCQETGRVDVTDDGRGIPVDTHPKVSRNRPSGFSDRGGRDKNFADGLSPDLAANTNN